MSKENKNNTFKSKKPNVYISEQTKEVILEAKQASYRKEHKQEIKEKTDGFMDAVMCLYKLITTGKSH